MNPPPRAPGAGPAATIGVPALLGLALGFSLQRMGFTDFLEVHRMFRFQDLRLLWTFLGGLALYRLALPWAEGGQPPPPRPLHPGTIPGGVLFGAGWALSGACPSVPLVQLGEGQLAALATLAGVLVGTRAYQVVHARWFRWETGACGD